MSNEAVNIRQLPHNIDSEAAVLGAVLLNNRYLDEAVEKINPEDFYKPAHRIIFQACFNLYQSGDAVDILTVKNELERMNALEQVGGAAYVASLVDGIPHIINLIHYVDIIKNDALLRKMIHTASDVMDRAYRSDEPAQALLENAERDVFAMAEEYVKQDFIAVGEFVDDVVHLMEERSHQKELITGIATGFSEFDNMTGGLQKGELVIIAARPSMGKSSLCLNIAAHAALRGSKTVGLFSIEDTRDNVMKRLLCSEARVNAHDANRGFVKKEGWVNIATSAGKFKDASLYVDDSAVSILEIKTKVRRLKKDRGLDMIIIDYLQLVRSSGVRYDSRVLEVAAMTQALKTLAKDLQVPVLLLSQLNRGPENRPDHRPRLADLRESGSIEQDADVVCFIYREDFYRHTSTDSEGSDAPSPESTRAELIVSKNRNGPTGTVPLVFFPSQTRFANMIFGDDGPPFVPSGDSVPF